MTTSTTTPILETPRLILRPTVFEDHVWVQDLFSHWDVAKYMNALVPWPYPANGSETYYRDTLMPDIASGQTLAWSVIEKASNTPIGSLSLLPHDTRDNRGFWLGLPYHGKGYMSEAVGVTTDYAFDVLGMEKLRLTNAKDNIGSANLKIKAGAVLTGEEDGKYVCGPCTRQWWELYPDAWRTSPLKKASMK